MGDKRVLLTVYARISSSSNLCYNVCKEYVSRMCERRMTVCIGVVVAVCVTLVLTNCACTDVMRLFAG